MAKVPIFTSSSPTTQRINQPRYRLLSLQNRFHRLKFVDIAHRVHVCCKEPYPERGSMVYLSSTYVVCIQNRWYVSSGKYKRSWPRSNDDSLISREGRGRGGSITFHTCIRYKPSPLPITVTLKPISLSFCASNSILPSKTKAGLFMLL